MGEIEEEPCSAKKVGCGLECPWAVRHSPSAWAFWPAAALPCAANRFSRSRTLVMYSSSLSRSSVPSFERSVSACPRTSSRMPSGRPRVGSPAPEPHPVCRRGTAWRTPSTASWRPARVRRSASRRGRRPRLRAARLRKSRLSADGPAANSSREIAFLTTGPARVLGAREEARRSLVREPRTHPRVRQARYDRELAAKLLEDFQVRREGVILAFVLWKEEGRVQPQRRANADHPPSRLCSRHARARAAETRAETRRQGQRHAGGLQECASVEGHGILFVEFRPSVLRPTSGVAKTGSAGLNPRQLAREKPCSGRSRERASGSRNSSRGAGLRIASISGRLASSR